MVLDSLSAFKVYINTRGGAARLPGGPCAIPWVHDVASDSPRIRWDVTVDGDGDGHENLNCSIRKYVSLAKELILAESEGGLEDGEGDRFVRYT